MKCEGPRKCKWDATLAYKQYHPKYIIRALCDRCRWKGGYGLTGSGWYQLTHADQLAYLKSPDAYWVHHE